MCVEAVASAARPAAAPCLAGAVAPGIEGLKMPLQLVRRDLVLFSGHMVAYETVRGFKNRAYCLNVYEYS